ncbi:uncharacterized protein G2W53_001175 [Senna tora]|uniref:Uncharacterized protein n=1 Tax=Senna tora TaxID=362788 RepID=A0A834XF27_9FABA|nr:uncharacterized protein G2W53_001175 [Senna tora]
MAVVDAQLESTDTVVAVNEIMPPVGEK